MNRRAAISFVLSAACLASCGAPKLELDPDPYRPVMAQRINAVIYSSRSREEMVAELAAMGVRVGLPFPDFKRETGIDDWFGEESDFLPVRYTSLTCGLSPVVSPEGKIVALYRSRKHVGGKMQGEMAIQPEN